MMHRGSVGDQQNEGEEGDLDGERLEEFDCGGMEEVILSPQKDNSDSMSAGLARIHLDEPEQTFSSEHASSSRVDPESSPKKLIIPSNVNISSDIVGDIGGSTKTGSNNQNTKHANEGFSPKAIEDFTVDKAESRIRRKSSLEEQVELFYYKCKGRIIEKLGGKKKLSRTFDSDLQGILSKVHYLTELYSQVTRLLNRYRGQYEVVCNASQSLGLYMYDCGIKDKSVCGSLMCNIGNLLQTTTKANRQLQPLLNNSAKNAIHFRNVAIEDALVTLGKTEKYLGNYDALKLRLEDLQNERKQRPDEIKRVKGAMDEHWDQFEQLLSVCRIKKDFLESKRAEGLSKDLLDIQSQMVNNLKECCVDFKVCLTKHKYIIEKSSVVEGAVYT
eukprot:Nk52_evm11s222 gene=Nk52_evmTU11s222